MPKLVFICLWSARRPGRGGVPRTSVLLPAVSRLGAHFSNTQDISANSRGAASELNGLKVNPLLWQASLHCPGRKGGLEGRMEASGEGAAGWESRLPACAQGSLAGIPVIWPCCWQTNKQKKHNVCVTSSVSFGAKQGLEPGRQPLSWL